MRTRTRSKDSLQLIEIPLERLIPHPLNPNVMQDELLAKLEANIRREDDYPPLVVRPHPKLSGGYEVLDGHQRLLVLERIGAAMARAYVWPCSDSDAELLVATLNRLQGEDRPAVRAALMQDLLTSFPQSDLSQLLPESERDIELVVGSLDVDLEKVLADMQKRAERLEEMGPRLISIAVEREDEELILRTLDDVASNLHGSIRRGRALAIVVREYLATERSDQ